MLYNINKNICAIENGDITEMDLNIDTSFVREFSNLKDFEKYCTSLDMKDILSLGKHCPCIFHDDERPSAGIFQKQGKFFYKCHCGTCGEKAMTIFQVVQRIRGKSYGDAVAFLAKLLNCKTPIKEKNHEIEETINKNIAILKQLENYAPTAARLLNKDDETLLMLYDFCSRNGSKQNKKGDILYSVTQRQLKVAIEEKFGKTKLVSHSLVFLAYLGFIERIPLYSTLIDIDTLIQYQSPLDNHSMRLTAQLLIKKLDAKAIVQIEKNAKNWKKRGYKKEKISFSYFCENESIWLANKLYPQMQ